MKKIIQYTFVTSMVLSLTVLTIESHKPNKKKDYSLIARLSQLSLKTNNAFALSTDQDAYNSGKREVNTEVANVVDAVNTLLTAASITSCATIPAASSTVVHSDGTLDLYSSTVGSHTTFPLSGISGISYTNLLELKLHVTGTKIGQLYVDCTNGGIEVRYLGKTSAGSDTDLAIGYYEDTNTRNQTILLASDYTAGIGGSYPAAKLAVHYTESTTSQSVTMAYAESAILGYVGTMTANTSGTVTASTPGNVTTGTAKTDLTRLVGVATFTLANINGMSITLY